MTVVSAAVPSTGKCDVVPTANSTTGMADVLVIAELILCSSRHVRRMADAGVMPRPVHVGRLTRWPLRTGNPTTGVLDWIDAGCPSYRPTKARAT